MAERATHRAPHARFAAMHVPTADEPTPLFVTQRRRLREFLADQERIATIKADWLYSFCGEAGRRKLLIQAGLTATA